MTMEEAVREIIAELIWKPVNNSDSYNDKKARENEAVAALMRLVEPNGLSAPLSHSTGVSIAVQIEAVGHALSFAHRTGKSYSVGIQAALETLRWVQGDQK